MNGNTPISREIKRRREKPGVLKTIYGVVIVSVSSCVVQKHV